MHGKKNREVYLVITQTGTVLSRICGFMTGAEYNHASISLDADLKQMYSFGRKHPYNPFFGGFVQESPDHGTFRRFRNTKAVIIRLRVTESQYERLERRILRMEQQKKLYHYNTLGLMAAAFHKQYRRDSHYYCSEFVWSALETAGVDGLARQGEIVQPIHFLEVENGEEIFRGILQHYPAERAAQAAGGA